MREIAQSERARKVSLRPTDRCLSARCRPVRSRHWACAKELSLVFLHAIAARAHTHTLRADFTSLFQVHVWPSEMLLFDHRAGCLFMCLVRDLRTNSIVLCEFSSLRMNWQRRTKRKKKKKLKWSKDRRKIQANKLKQNKDSKRIEVCR